jgi:hypothetical protein
MMEAARTSETLVNFYQIHGAAIKKTAIFVLTAVRTSNPTMHLLPGTPLHRQIRPGSWKFAALYYSKIFIDLCGNNYDGTVATLNFSTIYSTRQHLDDMFLIFAI